MSPLSRNVAPISYNLVLSRVIGSHYHPFKKLCLAVPYLIKEPEVVERNLHPVNGEQLKFLILATDGWELFSLCEHVYNVLNRD